jgi:hypothetical protein
MTRFALLVAVAWVATTCAKVFDNATQSDLQSRRTADQITYAANLEVPPNLSAVRAIVSVTNFSRAPVEFRLGLGCPLQIQLRSTGAPTTDTTAAWDSRGLRRGWECTGGVQRTTLAAGDTHDFFTEVSVEELNASLPQAAYNVFMHLDGTPSSGWLYGGRITLPLR